MIGQLFIIRWIEPVRLRQRFEEQRLIEAPHDHDPIDRLTLAREADGVYSRAGECEHLEIEGRRRATVQNQLALAGSLSQLRRREVEIGVFYRALQFVDMLPGNEYQRCMRLDRLDPINALIVGRRVLQECDDVSLIIGRHH